MRELLEMERDEEEKEFGKGFARGFFNSGGSSGAKKKKKKGAGMSSKETLQGNGATSRGNRSDGVSGTDSQTIVAAADGDGQAGTAGTVGARAAVEEQVIERVVERRGSRSGSAHGRRSRKIRAANLRQMDEGSGAHGGGETEGSSAGRESAGVESGPVVSKFRQMRQRQRFGGKG